MCGVGSIAPTSDTTAILPLLALAVNLDEGWAHNRSADGTIVADPKLFPNGIKAVADYIHSKGLLFGEPPAQPPAWALGVTCHAPRSAKHCVPNAPRPQASTPRAAPRRAWAAPAPIPTSRRTRTRTRNGERRGRTFFRASSRRTPRGVCNMP